MQKINVLLVEDNIGDIELTREAFTGANIKSDLHVASDGDEALDFFYKRNKYVNSPRPDIVLMDLNMPRKNGKEILSIVKSDETLKDIPVIILTSSEAQRDVSESYKLHANAYIVKPSDFEDFAHIVESLENFWMNIVKLPSKHKVITA